jgi:phosphatidylinositol-3-phosphatase
VAQLPLEYGKRLHSLRHRWHAVAVAAAVMVAGASPSPAADAPLPKPDHIVVVVMENHSFSQIFEAGKAPFFTVLALGGANFTNSFAITHPSQPNYFALFSGSTHNVTDDRRHEFDAPTLAGALAAAGKAFIGYVETGSPRKHNPWESFADSQHVERNLKNFPRDFAALPAVSFVIPNPGDDMHSGSVEKGDRWLKANIGAYAEWCKTHNSLLIVTFDEDDGNAANRIPTIFYGDHVKPGRYGRRITHYSVLSTVLTLQGLAPLAHAAEAAPITQIWRGDGDAAAEKKPAAPAVRP